MKEELETRVLENIDRISGWLDTTENIISEQSPLIVSEIISWGIGESVFFLVLWSVLFIIGFSMSVHLVKNHDELYENYELETLFGTATSCILSSIFFVCMISQVYYIIYINYAPRLYVLEYLKKLT